ncbi:hypothetical protein KSP40_PGU009182 [Platanthera guangdongensis]|uniref:Uncharacterized protein n=1 Tax=Platanthera guangdongensis TaxID=2320717 RepID=A0ABR2LKI1_9ASPA
MVRREILRRIWICAGDSPLELRYLTDDPYVLRKEGAWVEFSTAFFYFGWRACMTTRESTLVGTFGTEAMTVYRRALSCCHPYSLHHGRRSTGVLKSELQITAY